MKNLKDVSETCRQYVSKKSWITQDCCYFFHEFDLKDDLTVNSSQYNIITHFRCLMFKMVSAIKVAA